MMDAGKIHYLITCKTTTTGVVMITNHVRSFVYLTLRLYNTTATAGHWSYLTCLEEDSTNLLPNILGGLLWNLSFLD